MCIMSGVCVKPSVQTILFKGGGAMGKNIDSLHFQHFPPPNILALFFIIFMANYPFEKCWCVHFLRGEGGLRKYMFCTFINNYGHILKQPVDYTHAGCSPGLISHLSTWSLTTSVRSDSPPLPVHTIIRSIHTSNLEDYNVECVFTQQLLSCMDWKLKKYFSKECIGSCFSLWFKLRMLFSKINWSKIVIYKRVSMQISELWFPLQIWKKFPDFPWLFPWPGHKFSWPFSAFSEKLYLERMKW